MSNAAVVLGTVGPIITGLGAIMQYIEWRQSRQDSERLTNLKDYIDMLDEVIDDLRQSDKSPIGIKLGDVDPGEALAILQDGAELVPGIARSRNMA